MSAYMVQLSYTPEHFAAMAREPQDRSKAVAALMEQVGGRLIGFWYSFGEHDSVIIIEAPDERAAAAAVLAGLLAGHVRAAKTTQLLGVADALEAMRRAGETGLQAPGGAR